jgi:thioredoxin 1
LAFLQSRLQCTAQIATGVKAQWCQRVHHQSVVERARRYAGHMSKNDSALQLLCLCAAWCHLCTAYTPVFAEVAQRLRADWPDLTSRWIDIEDETGLVGELDIATFPTIVVLRGAQVLFCGPLPPQPEMLERVVRAALESRTADEVDPVVAAFARRAAA